LSNLITIGGAFGAGGYEEVANFAALPPAATSSGDIYVVLAASGIWPFTRRQSGLYYSNGASWTKLDELANTDIRDMYESNSDVNRYSNAEKAKVASAVQQGVGLGAGTQVYYSTSGTDMNFRSLVAGTNVTLDGFSNHITINASGGGGSSNSYFPSGW